MPIYSSGKLIGNAQGITVESPQRSMSEDLKRKARPEERWLRPNDLTSAYRYF